MEARTKMRTTVKDQDGNVLAEKEAWGEESNLDFSITEFFGYGIEHVSVETEVVEVELRE